MATIHCKACGKSYNYEKNGCCPECGAYNRPPRREQVYADGTVHHLDGSSRRFKSFSVVSRIFSILC